MSRRLSIALLGGGALAAGCGLPSPPADTSFFDDWDPDTGLLYPDTGSWRDTAVDAGEVWDNGPDGVFRVRRTVTVDDPDCVIVRPGTHVVVAAGARIEARACFVAEGTEDAPIRFSAEPMSAGGRWGGLWVTGEDRVRIAHVAIHDADIGLRVAAGTPTDVRVEDSGVGIELVGGGVARAQVARVTAGLRALGDVAGIHDVSVEEASVGVDLTGATSAALEAVEVTSAGIAVDVGGASLRVSGLRVRDARVGVSVGTGSVTVAGTVIRDAATAFEVADGALSVTDGAVAATQIVVSTTGSATLARLALVGNGAVARLTAGSLVLSDLIVAHDGSGAALTIDGGSVSLGPIAWLGAGRAIDGAVHVDASGGYWPNHDAAERVGHAVTVAPTAPAPSPTMPPLPVEDVARTGDVVAWAASPSAVAGYRVHHGPDLDALEPGGTVVDAGGAVTATIPGMDPTHDVIVVAITEPDAQILRGTASIGAPAGE